MGASRRYRHLFGPVPSRRLGRSLGIDLVPHKVCTLDCVYCECGATTCLTVERREWVPLRDVQAELEQWLADPLPADHLTFSGSGEPTLHRDLGQVISFLGERTRIPLALLTNGTLLRDPAVRAGIRDLAVILPSLDTVVAETFERLNRPHPDLRVTDLVEGLVRLREEFTGEIWLEVLLVEGLNDSAQELEALAVALERIRPDRIQVNTAVRPGTEQVVAASAEALGRALRILGPRAEAVAEFRATGSEAEASDEAVIERVLAVVQRRPETIEALAGSLGVGPARLRQIGKRLVREGRLRLETRGGLDYLVETRGTDR